LGVNAGNLFDPADPPRTVLFDDCGKRRIHGGKILHKRPLSISIGRRGSWGSSRFPRRNRPKVGEPARFGRRYFRSCPHVAPVGSQRFPGLGLKQPIQGWAMGCHIPRVSSQPWALRSSHVVAHYLALLSGIFPTLLYLEPPEICPAPPLRRFLRICGILSICGYQIQGVLVSVFFKVLPMAFPASLKASPIPWMALFASINALLIFAAWKSERSLVICWR